MRWGLGLAAMAWALFFIAAFLSLGDPPEGPRHEDLLQARTTWTRAAIGLGVAAALAAFVLGLRTLRRSRWRGAAILILAGLFLLYAGGGLLAHLLLA